MKALLDRFRLHLVLVLAILPWLYIIVHRGFTPFLIWCLALFASTGLGFLFLRTARFLEGKPERLAFAPGIGFLILAGLSGITAQRNLLPGPTFTFVMLAGLIGFGCFVFFLKNQGATRLPGKGGLIAVFWLVAFLILRPVAAVDMTTDDQGRFTWIDLDSQYGMALTSSLKMDAPPTEPGFVDQRLYYHFGAYAFAANLSRLDEAPVSESLFAVKALGLFALLCSVAGFGRSFGQATSPSPHAPALAVLGTLFLSTLKLPSGYTPTGFWPWMVGVLILAALMIGAAIKQKRRGLIVAALSLTAAMALWPVFGAMAEPEVAGLATIGFVDNFNMIAQFYIGHSVLWGLIGTATVFGLFLAAWPERFAPSPRFLALLGLGALLIPVNYPAGFATCGTLCALPVLLAPKRWPSYLLAGAGGLTVLLSAWAIGFFANEYVVSQGDHLATNTLPAVMGKLLGMGIILAGLICIRPRRMTPASWLILVFVAGCLIACLAGPKQTHGYPNHTYFIIFLHHVLAMAAGVYLAGAFRDHTLPAAFFTRGAFVAWGAAALLLFYLAFIGLRLHLLAPRYLLQLGLLMLLGLGLYGLGGWVSHRRGLILLALLALLGGWASLPVLTLYGRSPAAETVYLSKGESEAMQAIYTLVPEDARIATNKRDLPHKGVWITGRSFSYSAMLNRAILCEGYLSINALNPEFTKVRAENARMFMSKKAAEVRKLTKKHGVDYLLCCPNTDLRLPEPRPDWLEQVPIPGGPTLYRVKEVTP